MISLRQLEDAGIHRQGRTSRLRAGRRPYIVDFLWPGPALIAEVDGYRAHGGRQAFEADRARDTRLKLRGYAVVRFTWRQLSQDPNGTARALRGLLSRSDPAT